MRGKEGVFDTTRLLRRSPFGEWVTVYYDPKKVSEGELLKWIKANRCPRAAQVIEATESAVLTPYVARGDTAQIRIKVAKEATLETIKLPEGWRLLNADKKLSSGNNYLSIQTPGDAASGEIEISLKPEGSEQFSGKITVVEQVGKH